LAITVKLNSAKFSELFGKEIKARVLAEFSSPSSRQVLTRDFDTALEQTVDKLLNSTLPALNQQAKDDYKASLDAVGQVLAEGISRGTTISVDGVQVQTGFKPLTRRYLLTKKRLKPGTEALFWKFTGEMAKAYRKFSGARKSGIQRTKAVATPIRRGYQRQGRRYTYAIEFRFPEITSNLAIDKVFRQAYLLGDPKLLSYFFALNFTYGQPPDHTDPMSVLAFNETAGHKRSRPFIAQVMAARGSFAKSAILRKLETEFGR